MPAYVDYAYYTGTYLGTAISEADFDRLALRASAVINQLTFNRAVTDEDNEDAIKNAVCAVAEEIQTSEAEGGADGITSETVGAHSVSYAEHSSKQLTKEQRYYEAARLYLGSTGLMFAGFASGEYGS